MTSTSQPAPADFVPYETEVPTLDAGALYWDQRGAIACGKHAPLRGSDSWAFDRWRKMAPKDIAGFRRDTGRAPWCETCGAIQRNARCKEGR
ncbi:MAG: hypothetical protein EYC70_07080 [Planctomycetota bacterium]|nr:MAG: hypothetical protein EYC70_07080 [Planctomycetota bacterium]